MSKLKPFFSSASNRETSSWLIELNFSEFGAVSVGRWYSSGVRKEHDKDAMRRSLCPNFQSNLTGSWGSSWMQKLKSWQEVDDSDCFSPKKKKKKETNKVHPNIFPKRMKSESVEHTTWLLLFPKKNGWMNEMKVSLELPSLLINNSNFFRLTLDWSQVKSRIWRWLEWLEDSREREGGGEATEGKNGLETDWINSPKTKTKNVSTKI